MISGTIHSLTVALMFIAIFGMGSIIEMSLIGGLIGISFDLSNSIKIKTIMRNMTGSISFVLSMIIVCQIRIMENLFRS